MKRRKFGNDPLPGIDIYGKIGGNEPQEIPSAYGPATQATLGAYNMKAIGGNTGAFERKLKERVANILGQDELDDLVLRKLLRSFGKTEAEINEFFKEEKRREAEKKKRY